MYQMEKITTGVSYTTSAVGTGYWLLQLLDKVSPSQWVAIGVLGSLVFGLLTYLTNLYFKIAKWHLNRSQFGIRIDHDLASISDHSLASQSITIWHTSDH
ncbi:class II holin family protein [Escherichia albertii]|uniref:class II holin family protein n=1 Tax=Escherichia albertii TaxID=208962 RepID=UPI0023602AA0|nr:class II holin family protein [Escherichia albertii]WDB61970.1 class II holin family protein [Escherichia albertii]